MKKVNDLTAEEIQEISENFQNVARIYGTTLYDLVFNVTEIEDEFLSNFQEFAKKSFQFYNDLEF